MAKPDTTWKKLFIINRKLKQVWMVRKTEKLKHVALTSCFHSSTSPSRAVPRVGPGLCAAAMAPPCRSCPLTPSPARPGPPCLPVPSGTPAPPGPSRPPGSLRSGPAPPASSRPALGAAGPPLPLLPSALAARQRCAPSRRHFPLGSPQTALRPRSQPRTRRRQVGTASFTRIIKCNGCSLSSE